MRVEERLRIPFTFSRAADTLSFATSYDETARRLAHERRAIVRVSALPGTVPASLPPEYPFRWMAGALGQMATVECTTIPFCAARPISFVAITHRPEILERDLASSEIFASRRHQLIIITNPASATSGLNQGLERAEHGIVAFVHHDVYLPSWWESQLEGTLQNLDQRDPEWGVLGCAGARLDGARLQYTGSLFDGTARRRWGFPWNLPADVDTLDELLLIIRRESGLRFDETLSGFHAYGAQISLSARARGLRNYAALAECEHRSDSSGWSPDAAYFAAHAHVAKRWSHQPYGAMFGPMPSALPSPWREDVLAHHAKRSVIR
ncbi:hypothetical protein EPN44_06480 [bacterium]|nr:MAG: hypothetical protein EPN44_06480 [bacterium]